MATELNTQQPTQNQTVPQTPKGQVLSPLDEFDQWFDEVRRHWLSPMFIGRHWPELGASPVFGGRMPKVDVIDRDTEYCVRAELPGVSKDHLEVSLEESTLSLKATVQKDEQEEKGQYHRRETSRGEFQRIIQLPGAVDSENTKASFKDGVLELTIPKVQSAKRQSIKVE
ncbi:Hsp20/alpha crystallin family protein [Methylomagnum ishizawai]|uniref:Hsp20/alpha crystallin family protein n=1 Tax=Methylomagnum ishizawai TaxID=1760988 RepID=UPI001C32ABDC|nr:Hsp20/alpha crystallin family protein [Methylomagnum ishizawai]BBL74011.1 molecular chaperone [Methylomagnum ishizawai]